MTEEEANLFYTDNLDIIKVSRDEFISCLKNGNYIRKSALVELVEEAEKILNNDSDYYTPYDIGIVAKGFRALKKDHPEFGGKK